MIMSKDEIAETQKSSWKELKPTAEQMAKWGGLTDEWRKRLTVAANEVMPGADPIAVTSHVLESNPLLEGIPFGPSDELHIDFTPSLEEDYTPAGLPKDMMRKLEIDLPKEIMVPSVFDPALPDDRYVAPTIPKPTELHMGPKTYKFEYDVPLGEGVLGLTSHMERTIEISPHPGHIHSQEHSMTILHEVLHVIMDMRGVRSLLKGNKAEAEEALTVAMESGLAEVIQRNPQLMRYLVQEMSDVD